MDEELNTEMSGGGETIAYRWRTPSEALEETPLPAADVAQEEADTAAVYLYLAKAGGEDLVGPAKEMAPGTFWHGLKAGN